MDRIITNFKTSILFNVSTILLLTLLSATTSFAQPENDKCYGAVELELKESCDYKVFSLDDATLTGSPYSECANSPQRDVWFKARVPEDGILAIRGTTSLNPIISITIFTGDCGALSYYSCADDFISGKDYLALHVNDEDLKGKFVYIEVTRGSSNTIGEFRLCAIASKKPENDYCKDAILLENKNGIFRHKTFSNQFAGKSDEDDPSCGFYQGADVWFQTTMPSSGRIVVHAKSDDIAPVLVLYSGECGDLIHEGCATDWGEDAELIFDDPSLADQVVYIRVYADADSYGGEFGILVLENTQDICSEAKTIKAVSEESFAPYTNEYASTDIEMACSQQGTRGIWFVMEVPASGKLIIESTASNDNMVRPILKIYKGTCDNLEEVSCGYMNVLSQENTFGARAELNGGEGLHSEKIYVKMYGDNLSRGDVLRLSTVDPAPALPVELVKFTANTFNSDVILDWSTASEENNDYFFVEHSVDGVNFIPIDRVDGMGTTSELQQYNYRDENPYFGQNYYRLKQVDFDGAFEYSDVVVVRVTLAEEQFKLFPNPGFTKDVLTLRWADNLGDEELLVTVSDALGRPVYTQTLDGSIQRETTINCGEIDLDAGIYYLQLSNERQVIANRRFNLVGN